MQFGIQCHIPYYIVFGYSFLGMLSNIDTSVFYICVKTIADKLMQTRAYTCMHVKYTCYTHDNSLVVFSTTKTHILTPHTPLTDKYILRYVLELWEPIDTCIHVKYTWQPSGNGLVVSGIPKNPQFDPSHVSVASFCLISEGGPSWPTPYRTFHFSIPTDTGLRL